MKEQNEMVSQVSIDKMNITEVAKVGDRISVKMTTKLSKNAEGIKSTIIVLIFNKDVSESQTVNSLFSYLSRYAE